MDNLSDRLNAVLSKMAAAAARSGRNPDDIRLIAVSKNHPSSAVREAWACGQHRFGENRVQEAKSKIPESPAGAEWHLIGHLQKNKIRQALPLFSWIHGVDSVELATQIDRISAEDGHRPKILLEVNVAGESTKFGFKPGVLEREMEILLSLTRLDICGLMAMAPFAPDPESARPYFKKLRLLRDELQQTFKVDLPELSMGMSGDFEVAVEEGATLVRVGTSIFGERT